MPHYQKGFANIAVIIAILVVAGVVAYFILTRQASESLSLTPSPTPTPAISTPISTTAETSAIDTTEWKTYRNTFSRIELKRPQGWILKEEEEFRDKVSLGITLFSLTSPSNDCRVILGQSGGAGNLRGDLTYEDGKVEIAGKMFDMRTFHFRNSKDQIKYISIYSIPNHNYELQLQANTSAQFPYDIIQPPCSATFDKILSTIQFIQ